LIDLKDCYLTIGDGGEIHRDLQCEGRSHIFQSNDRPNNHGSSG